MGDARLRVVAHRPAELLELDFLAGHGLDHFGAGDEHVRGLFDHEDEVGHRRRVDGAAGAGAHDQADLRDHAGALDVADEDVAVGAERDDALLDPGAAGVVDADHRRPDLGGEVHHLAHLLRHHLAEAAAEDGEVLGEDEDGAAVDRAVAGDDGVAPGPFLLHLEVVGAVADEGVELLEGARVEQLLDPLARGHLALRVLLLDRLLGGRVDRRLAQLAQVGELLLVGDRVLLAHRGAGVYLRAVASPDAEGPAGAGPQNFGLQIRLRVRRRPRAPRAPCFGFGAIGRWRSSRSRLRFRVDELRGRSVSATFGRCPRSSRRTAADRLLARRAFGRDGLRSGSDADVAARFARRR